MKNLKDRVHHRPSILFTCKPELFKYNLLFTFMRQFIIHFYFNGGYVFEFYMRKDGSFVFKTNSLNRWSNFMADSSNWISEFCMLFDEESSESFLRPLTLNEVIREKESLNFLAVMQMLTKYFNVYIKQNGQLWCAKFKDGEFVTCAVQSCKIGTETLIEFKINEKIIYDAFRDCEQYFSKDMFYEMAQLCAMFFCGSEITVGQETSKGVVKKYYFYKSLAKYLEQKYKCNNALCNIVRIEYMEHMPNPNEAEIRVAMSSSSKNSNIEAYCNYRKLKYGKVFEAIEDALELDDNYYNIVINIFIRNPMWMNAEKRGISNQFIYDNLYKYLKTQLNKRKNI